MQKGCDSRHRRYWSLILPVSSMLLVSVERWIGTTWTFVLRRVVPRMPESPVPASQLEVKPSSVQRAHLFILYSKAQSTLSYRSRLFLLLVLLPVLRHLHGANTHLLVILPGIVRRPGQRRNWRCFVPLAKVRASFGSFDKGRRRHLVDVCPYQTIAISMRLPERLSVMNI